MPWVFKYNKVLGVKSLAEVRGHQGEHHIVGGYHRREKSPAVRKAHELHVVVGLVFKVEQGFINGVHIRVNAQLRDPGAVAVALKNEANQP